MKRMVISLVAVSVLAVGYAACCAAVNEDYILPHTVIDGIDVGGMNVWEASEVLEHNADEHRRKVAIDVRFAGKDYPVLVADAMEWEYQSAIKECQKPGQGAFWTRGYFLIRSFIAGNDIEITPVVKSEEAFEKAIKDSGLFAAGTTTQTVYQIKKNRLVFTVGTSGEEVDVERLKKKLKAAALLGDDAAMECPVSPGSVEEVDLEQIYREIYRKPKNATLDPKNNYQITESVTGIRFNKENARKALAEAEEGSIVAVDLILEEPEITTADLEEHLFSDKLSTYTTQVGGTKNRRDNISLAAQKCGSVILLHGDVFSYNDMVGEQTAETGYKLANATADGKLVQAFGGGICQVSSTIFAAALYADLEIKERWEHEYVSGYIGAGMDAAVAWDALDLKICNDKEYPVRIDTVYADGILSVDIWGTKTDDSVIEIDTKTVDDSEGTLSVQTYRKIYNGDKSQMFVEKVAYSTYLN